MVNDRVVSGMKEWSAVSFSKARSHSCQEGGVNLLAQLGDCAADDRSHYDVTSELVREISMAA